jgi:hypothetical protein
MSIMGVDTGRRTILVSLVLLYILQPCTAFQHFGLTQSVARAGSTVATKNWVERGLRHHGRMATALRCSEEGTQITNITSSVEKAGGWRLPPHQLNFNKMDIDVSMIQNDISVLSINTLGQAVIELVSKGPKSSPGMSLQDWVIVSRYFSVAASVSISWVLIGLYLGVFSGGVDEVLRDPLDRVATACQVWVLSAPLAILFIWTAGVPMDLSDTGLHLLSRCHSLLLCPRPQHPPSL